MPSKQPEIVDVLKQNVEVAEQIKAAASELEVVHAVLSTQVPPQAAAQGDLQAAVERTGDIEQQLTETAEALDKSNELLREISPQATAGTGGEK